MPDPKIYLSWKYIDIAIIDLSERLANIHIDSIIGIPRGGLIPAVMLSHHLNKPLYLSPHKKQYGTLLLVDDIIDSGHTIKQHLSHILANYPAITKVITASINITSKTTFLPDFYHEKFTDTWLVFPYEVEETSKLDYMETHLCNTCANHIATCNSKPEFGTGIGNDNVVKCDSYSISEE